VKLATDNNTCSLSSTSTILLLLRNLNCTANNDNNNNNNNIIYKNDFTTQPQKKLMHKRRHFVRSVDLTSQTPNLSIRPKNFGRGSVSKNFQKLSARK
jgi:hypothetical protein